VEILRWPKHDHSRHMPIDRGAVRGGQKPGDKQPAMSFTQRSNDVDGSRMLAVISLSNKRNAGLQGSSPANPRRGAGEFKIIMEGKPV
jgi:hypothetical protein